MSRPAGQRLFNVPTELSSFVGRRAELAEVKHLLGQARLVTLAGPGGVGKTRLALRTAATVQRVFPDGVWLVELARLSDPAAVAVEVGTALGLRDQSIGSSAPVLSKFIAGKHMLLVLDNCEHVLGACAELVAALLRACPRLRILTTSRQPLGLTGEQDWRVPPLSLPPESEPLEPGGALRWEAVRLFADRAGSRMQDFAVTPDNAQAVVQVCRRLDGIPLAIELAAARAPVLSAEQIVARLDDRFALLTAGDRSDDTRHHTLRAALDWTHDLLAADERLLWYRLSVFPAGFQLDAAEAVCQDRLLPKEAILGLLASLVEKSVVTPEHREAQVRYHLLETVREYGKQKLTAAGDEQAMRRLHRDWYAHMAADAEREYAHPRQLQAFDRLNAEHANLRAALQFCLSSPGEAEIGIAMAAQLWLYWEGRFRVSEGREWLSALLAIQVPASPARAKGLWAAGYLALLQSDVTAALALLDESRRLAGQSGDCAALAYATQFLGFAALYQGDMARSVTLAEEGLRLHRIAGNGPGAAGALLHLGMTRSFQGNLEAAGHLYEESLAISEHEGDQWIRSNTLFGLGIVCWLRADNTGALRREKESLRLKREMDDRSGIALCLEALGWITATDHQPERAAALLGAARSIWDALLTTTYDPWKGYHDACVAQARSELGPEAFSTAFRKGRSMNITHGLSYALEEPEPARSERSAARREPDDLTEREHEVAALVAQGLSNNEIAARLVVSPRTAESHVRHILNKLGFDSRAQIAAWRQTNAIPDNRLGEKSAQEH
jgi:predicted ATPase/DNA-binding CsgD family transcriptional regulator